MWGRVWVPCFLHGSQSIAHGVRLSARWFVVRLKPHAPLVWSHVCAPVAPSHSNALGPAPSSPPSSRGRPLDLGLGHL